MARPAANAEPLDTSLAAQLRAEAHAMAEAYLSALLAACPDGEPVGVYVKGSAYRAWDTAIDYVPELSDVDIHVRLAQRTQDAVGSLSFALDLGDAALATFRDRFANAVHTPRPQLFFIDDLERLPGYLPSPAGSVKTLHGAPYKAGEPAQYDACPPGDALRFAEDARYVMTELPGKVIDRPGPLLWAAVSRITWRVAPAGPRLLTQLGMNAYEAWTLNRSNIVRALDERGHPDIARAYTEFYLAGWDGFRSRFEDGGAARRALEAADQLFARGLVLLGGELDPSST